MNNFILKTQINENPPQLWRLKKSFNINTELKKNLNYLMRCHFLGFEPGNPRVECIDNPTGFLYFIGSQTLLGEGVVSQCFTRKSAKTCLANNPQPDWDGPPENFKNLVLTTPDDKLNDFLPPYLSIPALEEPTGYHETLKILRTTAEDLEYVENLDYGEGGGYRESGESIPPAEEGLEYVGNIGYGGYGEGGDGIPLPDYNVQYTDAFDFLKADLVNHVSELDNNGFSIAILNDNTIIFTAEAMIVVKEGPTEDEDTEISYLRVKSPPQKASYLRIKEAPKKVSYLRSKEPEISCSGAPNVASVWINYNYNSELSLKMVLEIDKDKYISANTNMPTHLFEEKYPHIQVMASSGGEYYFSNTSPTLSHRISMYELNHNAEVGGYSGDNKIQPTNINTVIIFCLGESKRL